MRMMSVGRRLRALVALSVLISIQVAVPMTSASAYPPPPVWDDLFGANYYEGCGYWNGTSDESNSCGSLQNNKWFAGRPASFGNQWPGIDTGVQGALSGDYDPTALVAYWTTTDNYPDVWFWDYWYPLEQGRSAWTDCPASNTGVGYYYSSSVPFYWETRWCRGQIVRYNASELYRLDSLGLVDIDGSGNGLPLWKFNQFLGCHELGHTVGLLEQAGAPGVAPSCLNYDWSGLPGLSLGWAPYLSQHDKDHLNANYG